jgi:hypothetical protein
MPFLQKKNFAVDNQDFYTPYLDRFDAFAARQPYRGKPELAFAITSVDVNVRRLGTFIRIEVKSIAEMT